MEQIVELFTSGAAGGLIGGFFGWLNRREDRKAAQAKYEFELNRISAQSTADEKASDARSFEASQQTLSKLGDAIKSAVRPVITLALLYLVWDILVQLESTISLLEVFPPDEAAKLYREIVRSVINLAAIAIGWWFAARPSALSRPSQ